jgi:hypothetical protein
MNARHLLWIIVFSFPLLARSQSGKQTIRGRITDRISEQALEGASIRIPGTSFAVLAGKDGQFILSEVPVGRLQLQVEFIGYHPVLLNELLLTTGKELQLEIQLEQSVRTLDEVTVKAPKLKKGVASNEYAVGSNRSINMEEVTRFSGGRNDPSKMVANFAGVISNDDNRNDIVVRGNSPSGVLWRVQGLPAPNPNHYASLGTTGGPITILNTNALKSADFFTGAFPAEYGNATAAVFDVELRAGNAYTHEFTTQVNLFSGLELMAEGPLSRKKKGASYLVGYRYSFVQIGQAMGLNVGTDAVPKYQNWVFTIQSAATKFGRFSIYGMGGVSSIDFIGKDIDTSDFYARQDQDGYVRNTMNILGVKHQLDLNARTYWKTAVAYNYQLDKFNNYQYPAPVPPYQNRWQITQRKNRTNSVSLSSYINQKMNAKLSWRAGITGELSQLDALLKDREGKAPNDPYLVLNDYNSRYSLWQAFAQTRYKPAEQWLITAGLHGQYFSFNDRSIVEPRASISWLPKAGWNIYLSYGLHAQTQPLPVYLYQEIDETTGKINDANAQLDFTKAHHLVAGIEKRFGNNWRLKAETYYQRLFDVPVESVASGFSVINSGADFEFPRKAGLVNEGSGTNYGLEITLEKFLQKGWYVLNTVSLFESKYKGSDGIERNTSFNYGYVWNVLGGKEWKTGKEGKNAFTVDGRFSTLGGRYATPVDLAASQAAGREILDESRYNSERLDSYLRFDLKFGYRINSKKRKLSQTFYLDLQNLTNRENIFLRRYNAQRGGIGNVYQLGFFPDLLYRIQF